MPQRGGYRIGTIVTFFFLLKLKLIFLRLAMAAASHNRGTKLEGLFGELELALETADNGEPSPISIESAGPIERA